MPEMHKKASWADSWVDSWVDKSIHIDSDKIRDNIIKTR